MTSQCGESGLAASWGASVAVAVSPCEPRTLGLPREPSGGPRAHRECSRSLLLELSSRADTDYPLTLSKTCSVTLDSSRDCRRYVPSLAWYDKEANNRQEVTMRTIARCFLLFGLVAVVPRVAAAQAAPAGDVKDTTGAVLPGVTVEAAGPALIEQVRTAVTDSSGRYR